MMPTAMTEFGLTYPIVKSRCKKRVLREREYVFFKGNLMCICYECSERDTVLHAMQDALRKHAARWQSKEKQ